MSFYSGSPTHSRALRGEEDKKKKNPGTKRGEKLKVES
jgi:hypothetical protein